VSSARVLELEPEIAVGDAIDAKPIDLLGHVGQPRDHHRTVHDRTPDELAPVIERGQCDVESSTSSYGERIRPAVGPLAVRAFSPLRILSYFQAGEITFTDGHGLEVEIGRILCYSI
jgi:hypothetical protein